MAERAKQRVRKKRTFFDDSDDDDFSNLKTPAQETSKPTRLKKKAKKEKTEKTGPVYTSTQGEVSPGGRGRAKRLSPEEKRFQKELEDALRLSADETVSSVELAPVEPPVHNPSTADTIQLYNIVSSGDEGDDKKQDDINDTSKQQPDQTAASIEHHKPVSMGMSEKEVFQGQNCEEIKEKDQAKEKDEVIELGSNNSRPSSRIDDQPKQDENTEPEVELDAKIDPLVISEPLVTNMLAGLGKRRKAAESWVTAKPRPAMQDKIAAMDLFIADPSAASEDAVLLPSSRLPLPAQVKTVPEIQAPELTTVATAAAGKKVKSPTNDIKVDADTIKKDDASAVKRARRKRGGVNATDDEAEDSPPPVVSKGGKQSAVERPRRRRLNVLDSDDSDIEAANTERTEVSKTVTELPEKRKRKVKRLDSDSDSDCDYKLTNSRNKVSDENSFEEDLEPADSEEDDDYVPASRKKKPAITKKTNKKSPAQMAKKTAEPPPPLKSTRPLTDRNTNSSAVSRNAVLAKPPSKTIIAEVAALKAGDTPPSKPEPAAQSKPLTTTRTGLKPERETASVASSEPTSLLTPVQSKTKSFLVGNSAGKGRSMPAWTPPARVSGTKLPTRANKNSVLSPPVAMNSSPSIGLRVGLSRNIRVKPLHASVKSVD